MMKAIASFKLSVSAEIKQAKIVKSAEIIVDRPLKHIKSFENICC